MIAAGSTVGAPGKNGAVLAALTTDRPGWSVQLLADDGTAIGEQERVDAERIAALETEHHPRWIWNDTLTTYPALLAAGVRLDRCHDIVMTERILLAREGRFGEPAAAAAVEARRLGHPVPEDLAEDLPSAVPVLFDTHTHTPDPGVDLPALVNAYLDQLSRVATAAAGRPGEDIAVDPGALRLLIAADSACALVAAEMGRFGMPWQPDVHDRILTEKLGARPAPGERPPKMAVLAAQINDAFGFPVNPDSAVDLRGAFRRAGFELETTRSWVIKEVDHPAVPAVLAYKELSRLHSANGWNWLTEWVRDGRFRADYVPAGVVTGRWATKGGGALQIPKVVRSAVVAEPGFCLVVADAAQLEPRVLVAVSGDEKLAALAGDDDLYVGLAEIGFSGDRSKAKLAMLGAMYGQTSGEAGRLVATLRASFPAAMACVETAARRGEQGRLVTTVLGRTSNPPSAAWTEIVDTGAGPEASAAVERRGRQVARDRGRFTRNFIIQGSAADWAAVWLSTLRQSLRQVPGAELVFFQHDELMVHCPAEQGEQVARMVTEAADTARRLVFPHGRARTPVRPLVVKCYADAK